MERILEATSSMNAVFISPYLKNRHAGGGEKHLFDVALALPPQIDVSIAIPHTNGEIGEDPEQTLRTYQKFYEQFMGVSLQRCKFVVSPLFTDSPWWEKLWWTKQYSHLYYVSDGSLFLSLARRNILHIQTPPHQKPTMFDTCKLLFWSEVSCNSNFTKSVFERYFGLSKNISVLYPLADAVMFTLHKPKKQIILHVGRFFSHQHSKRQDVLLDMYIKLMSMYPDLMKSWKLVLVGSVENQQYYKSIVSKARNVPIEIIVDCSRDDLLHLYAEARFFWSATGYNKNDQTQPQAVEHFGKAVVEAMAAGVIPIVTNKGGHKEILSGSLKQLLWRTQQECIELTARLIRDQKSEKQLRNSVIVRAQDFSEGRFNAQVKMLFNLES